MPPPIRRKILNTLPNLLPFTVAYLHVLLAPYTKVEESFTLHAVHDVLAYGPRWTVANWDHVTFPGAVPRSFLPALALGVVSYPIAALGVATSLIRSKVHVQILVRLILATLNAVSLNHLSRTLRARYGATVRMWWLILTVTGFHGMFYAGRTIPNFLAYPFVVFAISLLLRANSKSAPSNISRKRRRKGIIILTATATIIRLELALFLIPLALTLLLTRRMGLTEVLVCGAIGGFGSLAISAPIDYQLWQPTLTHPNFPFKSPWQLLWPELSGLWYNIVQGKADDWGRSHWSWYIVNGIPKVGLGSWVLSLVGSGWRMVEPKIKAPIGEIWGLFGLAILGLVGGMSCVGHKEWRFIIYILPLLNIHAAIVASGLWQLPQKRFRPFVRLGLMGIIAGNIAFTTFSTYVSMHNYPGGGVWRELKRLEKGYQRNLTIHYTTYPLQTGSTLFTFLHTPDTEASVSVKSRGWPFPAIPPVDSDAIWRHDKSEIGSDWIRSADYCVTEVNEMVMMKEGTEEWMVVGGGDGIDRVRIGKSGLGVERGRKVEIWQRVSNIVYDV